MIQTLRVPYIYGYYSKGIIKIMWPKIVKFSVVNVKEIIKHKDTKPSETCKDKLYMPLNKGYQRGGKNQCVRER